MGLSGKLFLEVSGEMDVFWNKRILLWEKCPLDGKIMWNEEQLVKTAPFYL